MKHTEGRCRINGLHITDVTIQHMPKQPKMVEAIYALGQVDPRLGIVGTHGKCTAYTQNWSKGTMKLLDELLESMEEDLLPRHFEVTAGMEDKNEGIESREDEGTSQI